MAKKKPAGFAYMKKHDKERFKEVTSRGGRSAQEPKGFKKRPELAKAAAEKRWKKYYEEQRKKRVAEVSPELPEESE